MARHQQQSYGPSRSQTLAWTLMPMLWAAIAVSNGCGNKSGGAADDKSSSGDPSNSPTGTPTGFPTGGPGSKLTIAGQLAVDSDADTAVAFPISSSGKVDHMQVQSASKGTVQAGALNVGVTSGAPLTTTGDAGHLVIVYDSQAGDRFAQGETMKFVSMPVGSEGLLALPTTEATTDKIDFGTITSKNGEFQAEKSADGGQFSTSAAQLATLGAVDNSLRMAKNALMNTDSGNYLNAGIGFVLRTVHDNTLDGNFAAPTHDLAAGKGMPEYVGYGFKVEGYHTNLQVSNICGANRKSLEFVPAGASDSNLMSVINEHDLEGNAPKKLKKFRTTSETENSYTVTESARWDNKGGCVHTASATYNSTNYSSINVADIHSFAKTPEGKDMMNIGFGGNDLVYGPIRQGLWDFKYDGVTIAKFDLGVADPMTTVTSGSTTYKYPSILIPQVRVVTNPNKSIKQILVRLYNYKFNVSNPTASSFELVTDVEVLKRVISFLGVEMYGVKKGSSGSDKSASVHGDLASTWARFSNGTFTYEDPSFAKFYLLRTADTAPTDDNGDVEDGPYLVNFVNTGYEMFGNTYSLRGKLDCDHYATPGPWKCQF